MATMSPEEILLSTYAPLQQTLAYAIAAKRRREDIELSNKHAEKLLQIRMNAERQILKDKQDLYDKQGAAMGERANSMYEELQELQREQEQIWNDEVKRIRQDAFNRAADQLKAQGLKDADVSLLRQGVVPPALLEHKKYGPIIQGELDAISGENLFQKISPQKMTQIRSLNTRAESINRAMQRILADPRADLSVLDFGRQSAQAPASDIDAALSQYESLGAAQAPAELSPVAATPQPVAPIPSPETPASVIQYTPMSEVGLAGRAGEVADVFSAGLPGVMEDIRQAPTLPYRVGQDVGTALRQWAERILFGSRGRAPAGPMALPETAPIPLPAQISPSPAGAVPVPERVPPEFFAAPLSSVPGIGLPVRLPATNRVETLQIPRPAILEPPPVFLAPR